MKGVTDRQVQILKAIQSYSTENGFSPSIRDIGAAMGIHSLRGVTVHLDALERKGYLRRAQTARGIVLTEDGRRACCGEEMPPPSAEQRVILAAIHLRHTPEGERKEAWRELKAAVDALEEKA